MVMYVQELVVTEFLVVEKKLLTNIHKRIKLYALPVLLIKAMLVVEFRELQVLRKVKWSSVTCVALAGQQVQLLRNFLSVLVPCGQTINQDLFSQTPKIPQKHFRLSSASQNC
jgi:hypothetical protein